MKTTTLQLHKRDSGEYTFIQDKYAYNLSNKTYALADGTTQSFKSERWAEILTSYFVENPTFSGITLIADFEKCIDKFKGSDFEISSNPAKASLEKAKILKGGTATFIGVQFTDNNKLKVISCGDSNLFILGKTGSFDSFPFINVNQLDSNNHFINTENLIEGKIDASFFNYKEIDLSDIQYLVLATDALSRLILQKPERLSELIKLNDFDDLHRFCLKYWEAKELQEDDISAIIVVVVDDKSEIRSIYPPEEFSFPKEKEEQFIPTSIAQNKSQKFTDMQMQEIRNQFNGVANDFFKVKKRINFLIVLFISSICLLLMSILFVFLFWTKNVNSNSPNNAKPFQNTSIEVLRKKNNDLEVEIKRLKKQLKNQASSNKKASKPEPSKSE